MSDRICLFAGTKEGRYLAEVLSGLTELTVCVATEYGEVLLDGIESICIHTGRMDAEEMTKFFSANRFSRIIDATHPYASFVTENIQKAAKHMEIPVIRILREASRHIQKAVYVSNTAEAADYLRGHEGNIFLTTGAKELAEYKGLDMTRVWARVLPLASSLEACRSAGIISSHIIAAQGPFSEEMNLAQMRMIGARFLVTKASGKSGGFEEKIRAAEILGAIPVIIGQPPQINGYTLDEALIELRKTLSLGKTKIYIIGIGPGSIARLTAQAKEILHNCDAVIGAESVVDSLNISKPIYHEFLPHKVDEVLKAHPSIRCAAVVMRGDVGFYSGAKKLLCELKEFDVTVVPGISSISEFAARLGVGWDDAALMSLHGRDGNLIHALNTNKKLFVLTGGENTVSTICKKLCEYGFGKLPIAVGERLTYADERIIHGKVQELCDGIFDPLSIVYIENEQAKNLVRHGIPDEEFIRGDTPMTKSEVRTVSLSKLCLDCCSLVYDIGAGTGSVSVECALAAYEGKVYAIEKNADAAKLIRQNKLKFLTDNLQIIEGIAPEALSDLPIPTHAFVGGSSGNLKDIIAALLRKNTDVRIVVNAATLETQTEAFECARMFRFESFETVSVNISRSRKIGRYNMMTAQNPVSVITMQKGYLND